MLKNQQDSQTSLPSFSHLRSSIHQGLLSVCVRVSACVCVCLRVRVSVVKWAFIASIVYFLLKKAEFLN